MPEKVFIYDTTLRDGAQALGVSFSTRDKIAIAKFLDRMGFDYIEGGWPGSNPKDMEFFDHFKEHGDEITHSKLAAFGSTCRVGKKPEEDDNVRALIEAGTPVVTIFGKSWLLHVKKALRTTEEENLRIIRETVSYLKKHGKEVVYDAEHFFDGYKDEPEYALKTIEAALEGGADWIVLADTNGGSLPFEIERITREAVQHLGYDKFGIHAHNDSGCAVANSLSAVRAGARHVQGTVNGIGERTGNADLIVIIANLQIKMGFEAIPAENLKRLTELSRFVYELANIPPNVRQPYVGEAAFTHKGGVHVSAVQREASTYEHIDPSLVGNTRRVSVSELSGRSNIIYFARELGLELDQSDEAVRRIVKKVKELEHAGYHFEAARATLELLIKKELGLYRKFFDLNGFRVIVEKLGEAEPRSEATIKITVNSENEHTAAEGDGPVNALDNALRKALRAFYKEYLDRVELVDYKVRVLEGEAGTAAKVRVLITSTDGERTWTTVGVSTNIIEASWIALTDSLEYYLNFLSYGEK